MSDKEIQEELNNDDATEATETPSNPASELVDLVLSGELHAANEKFHGIVESKVVTAIEDEKLKIAQTLFAEEDEEPLEEAPKAKVKEDDDDNDDEDDDEEEDGGEDKPDSSSDKEDDDSDSDSDDDDDSGDKAKPKKGKVPPQFMKKEDAEPVDEISADLARRAGEKAMGKVKSVSGSSPELGTSKSAKSDAKRKRQTDKFDAYANRKDDPKKGQTAAQAAGKAGRKSDQQRHTDWRSASEANEVAPEQSFDPGEESSNAPIPEGSFVAQVADYLAGNRN